MTSGPHLWEITAVREAFLLVVALGALVIAYELSAIFTPVLIALLAAYLVRPVIDLAERRLGLSPHVTAALLLLAALALVVGLGMWLGPVLKRQVVVLSRDLPTYAGALSSHADEWLQQRGIPLATDDLVGSVSAGAGRLLGLVGVLVSNLADLALGLAIGPLCFYAFATRLRRGHTSLERWVPEAMVAGIRTALHKLDESFAGYFRGRFLIALVTAPLFCLGWEVTGVPYWLLLGCLAAVLNIVPYLSILAWLAAVTLTYAHALVADGELDLLAVLVWPSVTYGAVQFLEGWLLTPLIQSREVDLSPAAVVVAVATGGAVGGVIGMVLAVPLAAAVKTLAGLNGRRDRRDRRGSARALARASAPPDPSHR